MAQPAPLSTGETLAAVYDRLAALAPAHGRPPPDAEARDAAAKRPAAARNSLSISGLRRFSLYHKAGGHVNIYLAQNILSYKLFSFLFN